jgi:hypothetical protein
MAIAGFTTRESGCVSEAVALSVAFAEKFAVVAAATALGIPLITPALLNDIPPGTEPLASVQVNAGVPPLTLSVRVHSVPAVHACSGLVLIAGEGLMTTVKFA